MVRLTFYGGVNEIGGNKILVEDRGARVFFDFGECFGFGCGFFTDRLGPRAVNGLGDFFEFDLLPRLRGLYSKAHLESAGFRHVEPRFDAVFLSHAHFDHVNHICFLDSKIPVYVGEGAKLFLESMEETSGFCDYGEHVYRTFRTGDKIKVGAIVVEPVHVDHSIPAAYGFIVHTSEGAVVYTGDLRMHGARRDLTDDFLEKAKSCESDALVCEGTRMVERERRQSYSESEVQRLSSDVVSSADRIVFVARYSRDMDRFRSFYKVAEKNGRKLVVSPKTAYLLSKLLDDRRLGLPDPLRDENVLVYFKRKKSGRFDDADYFVWERKFLDRMVTFEFVRKHQRGLVMDLDFYQFGELIDVKPEAGGHFIHSMSEPFSEEDIEDVVMHNWLDHFGLRFHQLHASGHLDRGQIGDLVDYVGAGKVFPVHTENPQLFKKISDNVQVVRRGKAYKL